MENELRCCSYKFTDDCPVKWNQFNKVVQCHNCGQIYEHDDGVIAIELEGKLAMAKAGLKRIENFYTPIEAAKILASETLKEIESE